MLGRLVHSVDFERMLAAPTWSRSAHFAVHHLPGRPAQPGKPAKEPAPDKLSTGPVNNLPLPVDDLSGLHWLGTVVPKRHARRSVTRNLLRRQIRGAMERHADRLPGGLWVVRLRAPFVAAQFVSAASDLLRQTARSELDRMLQRGSR
jgi:ribonuclease P protein component